MEGLERDEEGLEKSEERTERGEENEKRGLEKCGHLYSLEMNGWK